MSNFRDLLNVLKPGLQSIHGIFCTKKALAKINCIAGKGASILGGLCALVNCAIIGRALLHDSVYRCFDEWVIEAIDEVRGISLGRMLSARSLLLPKLYDAE
jgi:hypothetical protein